MEKQDTVSANQMVNADRKFLYRKSGIKDNKKMPVVVLDKANIFKAKCHYLANILKVADIYNYETNSYSYQNCVINLIKMTLSNQSDQECLIHLLTKNRLEGIDEKDLAYSYDISYLDWTSNYIHSLGNGFDRTREKDMLASFKSDLRKSHISYQSIIIMTCCTPIRLRELRDNSVYGYHKYSKSDIKKAYDKARKYQILRNYFKKLLSATNRYYWYQNESYITSTRQAYKHTLHHLISLTLPNPDVDCILIRELKEYDYLDISFDGYRSGTKDSKSGTVTVMLNKVSSMYKELLKLIPDSAYLSINNIGSINDIYQMLPPNHDNNESTSDSDISDYSVSESDFDSDDIAVCVLFVFLLIIACLMALVS